MIALVVYGVAVALLLIVGARAAEWLARGAGVPVRWIWAGAMFGTLVLSFTAASRATRARGAMLIAVDAGEFARHAGATLTQPTVASRVAAIVVAARQSMNGVLARATVITERGISARVGAAGIACWTLSTLVLLTIFAMVQRRMRRARGTWPIAGIAGARVRISPTIGPLVAGVVRPEIVVPRWLLDRTSNEQRMVVAHEAEHLRAGDPALLGAAYVALALMPWNPALWYMYARLRLAVELDCDARVLRGGSTAPASYGALLIDVAERASVIRLSALALADDTSHLHQRILAMKPAPVRFVVERGAAALLLGTVALLAACAADLPTAADIERMDASTAAASAKQLAFTTTVDTAMAYIVDGVTMRASEARAIAPGDIDHVRISKDAVSGHAVLQMWTKRGAAGYRIQSDGERRVNFTIDGKAGSDTVVVARPRTMYLKDQGFMTLKTDPVMFIDGVRVEPSALKSIDRTQIANVEVIKGPSAAKLYGPDAAAGAIIVHTKNGAKKD